MVDLFFFVLYLPIYICLMFFLMVEVSKVNISFVPWIPMGNIYIVYVESGPRAPGFQDSHQNDVFTSAVTDTGKGPPPMYKFTYCWWKKSFTTWVKLPVNIFIYIIYNGIHYLSTGAGFLASTVFKWYTSKQPNENSFRFSKDSWDKNPEWLLNGELPWTSTLNHGSG